MRSVPEVSVAALAYLGDSILEVCVRTYLVSERGISSSAKLNRAALSFVTATAQSEAVGRIEPHLTEEEAGVVRRARNARQTPTKNADAREYHRATALEALIGYLYLTGQRARMEGFLGICMQTEGQE